MSVPGSLQTVQRAEYWEVILAIPVHLGIDSENVCNNVGRHISGWAGVPLCLCADGDLLNCTSRMLEYRPRRSLKVSKVEGRTRRRMLPRILQQILAG